MSCSSCALMLAQFEPPVRGTAEVWWWVTGIVSFLLVGGLVTNAYTTRSGIITRATTKEVVRQPVFAMVLQLSLVFLCLLTILPYFSLGEDVKMLKDCGLATILFAGILLGTWSASTSIASEIEGRTTITLLSKPINRRQFILGKYLGILQSILLMLLPLCLLFLSLIYLKVGYDAREAGKSAPEHAEKFEVMLQIIPGIVLVLMEIAVLTAVSVALSTRVPMIFNLVSCLAIFIIGHLAPILVKQSTTSQALEYVQFFAQLIATVLPSLQVFGSQAAVAAEKIIPPAYLGVAALYSAAYATAAMLLAFLLFEDRDLA